MYCVNCGNKLDENADVCLKCGTFINNKSVTKTKVKTKNKDSNATGIISIIFSSLSLLIGFDSLSSDISSVSFYTTILKKILFIIDHVGVSFVFMIVGLILAISNKNKICNKVGLGLSFISIFLIITEIVIVFLY